MRGPACKDLERNLRTGSRGEAGEVNGGRLLAMVPSCVKELDCHIKPPSHQQSAAVVGSLWLSLGGWTGAGGRDGGQATNWS